MKPRTRLSNGVALACLSLLLPRGATGLHAQGAPAPTVLRAARLIDPKTGTVTQNPVVVFAMVE